jgi:hypothetical protein
METGSTAETDAKATTGDESGVADRRLVVAVGEWADYTLARANQLDLDARDAADNGYNQRRLRTKAGVFRSLALEVKQILRDNVAAQPPCKNELEA